MIEQKTIKAIKHLILLVTKKNKIDKVAAENTLNEIHNYFEQITGISGFDLKIENMAAVPAAKGKALGLNFAAQCLLDYTRTIKFLKAIIFAITEKRKKQPEKVIKIFYAGCGPYATLITLVAPYFKPEEVKFTLLEINKNAMESAKKIIKALKLSDYLEDFYLEDAVTFKVPKSKSFDILISETLDAGLYRECYVPILFNLLPQFHKNVVLIPENVTVNLSLVSQATETSNYKEHDVGCVLNARKSIASYSHLKSIPTKLADKKIELNSFKNIVFNSFLLDTKVHIYKDIWLYRNESSLTKPLEFVPTQTANKNTINFTYYMEPEIELKFTFE